MLDFFGFLKHSSKFSLTLGVVALVASGCRAHSNNGSEILNDIEEDPVLLKLGIDLDSLQAKQICVDGESVPADASGVGFTFGRVESVEEAARQIGFQSDVSFAYGIAKAKASAKFARNLSDTSFSATYLFSENIENTVTYSTDVRLRDNVNPQDPVDFRARCGNAYVSKVRTGGQLFAAVTFVFSDAKAKSDFSSTFNVKVGTGATSGSAKGKLEAMISEASETVTMKIEFNQKGGDPASIASAFPRGSDAIICSMQHKAECQALISSLFDYATNVFPGDVAKRPIAVSYETHGYTGINFPGLPPEVAAARTETVDGLKRLNKDRKKVSDLLASPVGYGTEARKQKLLGILETIDANLQSLQANIIRCVEKADETCRSVEALHLASYDQAALVPAGSGVITASVGGTGGVPTVQRCADFVTGVWGESGVILDRVGTICQGGNHMELLGSGRASPFDVSCPSGSVVTGVRGHREQWRKKDLVGNLILECTDLDSLRGGQSSPAQDIHVFSPEQATEMKARCEPGMAAIAVHYRAGSKVDAIALECIQVK